jgi:hypothetical protein
MRPRTFALGLAVATTALALAWPALGEPTSFDDPNDTEGRLDVRTVRFDGARPPSWKIATFGPWTARQIWDRGYLMVQLDMRGDARVDHLAIVRSDGRDLLGSLNRVRRDGRLVRIGGIAVDKQGDRAVSLSIRLDRLSIGPGRTSYFWSVLTSTTSAVCPHTCFDAVPNTGMIEQPLPSPSPSPSPTGPSGST